MEARHEETSLPSGTRSPGSPTQDEKIQKGSSTPSHASAMEKENNTPREPLAMVQEGSSSGSGANAHDPMAQKAEDQDRPQRSKLKIALIMFSLALAVLLVALDITIVTTALPTIVEEFQSASGYSWVGAAYLIACSATTPTWGKMSDIFGRKPALLLANAIFFVGSLLAGVSVHMPMLIGARIVQGLGGGGLIILVNIAISDLFSMRERGQYFGIIGGVWALASSLGPVMGGVFTQRVSWRWCFYINLPLDGLAFFILFFFLDIHTPKTPILEGLKAIDWIGSLVIVGGTTMLLLGLQFGGVVHPWASATVLCLIIFGILCIAIFFFIEWRLAPYPLMPPSLFSKRSNLAAFAVCFCHAFVFISANYFLPIYFQAVLGASPILSGVYLLATALSLSLVSAFTGVFIRKTGQYLPPIWFGMFVMTIGFGLLIDLDVNSSWAKIIIYQIIAGIGVGPNFQSPLIALQSFVPKRDIATATATFGFTRNVGSAVSIVVGSVVFNNRMKSKQAQLAAAIGPRLASAFSGASAGASVNSVKSLPSDQRAIVRKAFADSLSTMWIVFVAFSAAGLAVSLLITRNELDETHAETKTGLEAEAQNRILREAERRKGKAGKEPLPVAPKPEGDKETDA